MFAFMATLDAWGLAFRHALHRAGRVCPLSAIAALRRTRVPSRSAPVPPGAWFVQFRYSTGRPSRSNFGVFSQRLGISPSPGTLTPASPFIVARCSSEMRWSMQKLCFRMRQPMSDPRRVWATSSGRQRIPHLITRTNKKDKWLGVCEGGIKGSADRRMRTPKAHSMAIRLLLW